MIHLYESLVQFQNVYKSLVQFMNLYKSCFGTLETQTDTKVAPIVHFYKRLFYSFFHF